MTRSVRLCFSSVQHLYIYVPTGTRVAASRIRTSSRAQMVWISSGMATSGLLGVEQRVDEVHEATDTEDGSDEILSHAEQITTAISRTRWA